MHKKKIIGMDVLQKTILSDRYLMISFNAEQLTGMSPGDHIASYPKNNEKEVQGLMGQLKDLPNLEAQIQLSSKNSPIGTIGQLLTNYYDINALVSEEDLEFFAKYMGNNKDKSMVGDLTKQPKLFEALRIRFLDIFEAFPSLALPTIHFMERLGKIRPRWYSIASSTLVQGGKMDLVLSIVKYKLPNGRPRQGLCSRHLLESLPGDVVNVFHQPKSMFQKWLRVSRPLILVANGSGIAPFRGIWQEIEERDPTRPALLFFGCQGPWEDLFAEETDGLVQRFTACSRDAELPKKYVQDVLIDKAELVARFLVDYRAALLVCGSVSEIILFVYEI